MKAKGIFISTLLVIDTFLMSYAAGFHSRHVLVINPKLPPVVHKAEDAGKAKTPVITPAKAGDKNAHATKNKHASKNKPESKATTAPAKSNAKSAAKPDAKSAAKPDAKPEVKPAAKPAAKAPVKPVAKPAVKHAAKPKAKPAVKADEKPGA